MRELNDVGRKQIAMRSSTLILSRLLFYVLHIQFYDLEKPSNLFYIIKQKNRNMLYIYILLVKGQTTCAISKPSFAFIYIYIYIYID
jgi:hypothetical protein